MFIQGKDAPGLQQNDSRVGAESAGISTEHSWERKKEPGGGEKTAEERAV